MRTRSRWPTRGRHDDPDPSRGSPWRAGLAVIGGAIADPCPGLAILWCRWVKPAALGMLALSGADLVGSLVAARDLWADPWGGVVKVFPALVRDENPPLPQACCWLYRWWFAFGFPAFAAVLAMIWLMLTKPALP